MELKTMSQKHLIRYRVSVAFIVFPPKDLFNTGKAMKQRVNQ